MLPPPSAVLFKRKIPVLPQTKITKRKITQRLLAAQTLRSRVFYGPIQWQCRKGKLSGFLCELMGWLYFRIRKTAVRLSKVTVRAVFSQTERKKEPNRENMQGNCSKSRCFMTGQSTVTQLKKSCDKALQQHGKCSIFSQSQVLFCLTDAGKQPCCNLLGTEDQ